jgi:uroporphyrinogen decarboxylase
MNGGIDKRVLAQGPEAIDRHLAYILPAMKARGGYFPTCDHMVPVEVSFENYCHYRRRLAQYAKG